MVTSVSSLLAAQNTFKPWATWGVHLGLTLDGASLLSRRGPHQALPT
jgi:hypothetical protein